MVGVTYSAMYIFWIGTVRVGTEYEIVLGIWNGLNTVKAVVEIVPVFNSLFFWLLAIIPWINEKKLSEH